MQRNLIILPTNINYTHKNPAVLTDDELHNNMDVLTHKIDEIADKIIYGELQDSHLERYMEIYNSHHEEQEKREKVEQKTSKRLCLR